MNRHTQQEILEAIGHWESEMQGIEEAGGFIDKIKTGINNFKENRAKKKEEEKDAEKKKFSDKTPAQNSASKDLQHVMETEEIGDWPIIVARKAGNDGNWTYHLVTGFISQHDTDDSDGSVDLYGGYTVLMYDSRPVKGNLSGKSKKLTDLVKTNVEESDVAAAHEFEKKYPDIANIIKTERISTEELPDDELEEYIADVVQKLAEKSAKSHKKKITPDEIKDECRKYLKVINDSQDFENNAKNGFLFMYDGSNDDIDEFGKRAIVADTEY